MSRSIAPNTHSTGIYRKAALNVRRSDILKRHPMKEGALNVNAADIMKESRGKGSEINVAFCDINKAATFEARTNSIFMYLLDPDDWLGRRPGICLVFIAAAIFIVGTF